jgi:hypothetical protein
MRTAFTRDTVPQAVCLLRPTGDNVALLRRHLRKPKYGEYHLCTFPRSLPNCCMC